MQHRFPVHAALAGAAVLVMSGWVTAAGSQTIADIPDIALIPLDMAATSVEETLYLKVILNGRDTGLIGEFCRARDSGTVSSTASELEEVGVRTRRAANARVTLDSVAGLDYALDEVRQVIAITAETSLIVPQLISARPAIDQPEPQSGLGAVLNYRLSGNLGDNVLHDGFRLSTYFAALDGRVFSPLGVLSTTGFISSDGQSGSVQVRRQDTNFVYSAPQRMLTFTIGDFVSSTLPWSRGVRMGGVQLRRDFSLRSDVITNPMLSYTGVAALPTTVDLYVDSVRKWSGETDAGPFVVHDLPFVSSPGDVVFILRDASGREEEVQTSFFPTQELLRDGHLDFSLQTGYVREDYGLRDVAYGSDQVGSATMRYGVTDKLTVQGHQEAGAGLWAGSFGLSTVVFNRAEMTLVAGASRYADDTGRLAHASLWTGIGSVELRANSTRTTDGYRDLAYAAGAAALGADASDEDFQRLQPTRARDVLSLSVPVKDAHLGINYVHTDRNDITSQIASVSYSQPIGKSGATFRMNGLTDLAEGGFGVSFAVSMRLGPRSSGSVGITRAQGGDQRAVARASRPLDISPGSYAYATELSVDEDGLQSGRVAASYRSRFGTGDLAVRHDTHSGRTAVRAELEGSLVAAGGGIFAANPIRDAFAVVDVGVPGVPVNLHNRAVARTGASGKALVPNLQSLRRNRISIDPGDLPLDAAIEATGMFVVPARRSGVTATLSRGSGASALVIVRDTTGAFIAPGTPVSLTGNDRDYVVGYDGALWLDGLGAQNEIRVETPAGGCVATFAYTANPGDVVTIDPVECR